MRLHSVAIGLVWLNLCAGSVAIANDPPPRSTVTNAGPSRVADPGQEAKDKTPFSTAVGTVDCCASIRVTTRDNQDDKISMG